MLTTMVTDTTLTATKAEFLKKVRNCAWLNRSM